MRIYNKRTDTMTAIAQLLSIVILVHLLLTPLAYTQKVDPKVARRTLPLLQYEDVFLTNEVNNFELFGNIRISPVICKNLKEFQRLLQRMLDISLIPAVTYVILLVYTLTYYKKTRRRKSLLAISLGGHAPPVVF
jgi:hypothetical protein